MTRPADPMRHWRLTPVINVAGTMTSIGASRVPDEIVDVVGRMLGRFVSMDELQARASAVIAEATGAEAGCVTDCSAAAMAQCVAAVLTGSDLAAIEALPETGGRERRVAIQVGHMINYGAPVDQAIRLAGAEIVPIGTAALCETFHLRRVLEAGCAAAFYVVSHHTVREGELPLDVFVETCREHGVPVIVDMASEYDLRGPIALGADLVVYSGHKFLSATTSGIVAGTRDLVRAVYLQHRGIGRCMKVGKEGVVGAMAALELWAKRDAVAVRKREEETVAGWLTALSGVAGLSCTLHYDWTGNPITRLKIVVDPREAGLYAWELAERLAAGTPSIAVRDDHCEAGEIYLDPCQVTTEEANQVSRAIAEAVAAARKNRDGCKKSWSDMKRNRERAILSWPDMGGRDGAA